jgi:crotonobetainyl-CoA:carnitine CoA-transferase CaiB-like acyl-CoA transferase
MQVLDGIAILDLSGGIAGPLGVLQLAEHGADVIKVEPPGGRADRGSPASRVYNRSRRSVTLDLKTPTARRSSGRCARPPTCSSRRSRPARWPASASTTRR